MTFIPGNIPDAPGDRSCWLVFNGQRLLVEAESAALPGLPDPSALGLDLERPLFVGTLAGDACFAVAAAGDPPAPPGLEWISLRTLLLRFDDATMAAAGRASQLVDWDRDHRFCGRCASSTVPAPEEHCRRCPHCGLTVYPRISPVVMALVKRGRQLLLARGPHFPPGMFSALAGFIEAGETAEDTLVREVREEVGLEIGGLRYFGSQSWPFPNSLMLAYVCDYAGGDITPQPGEISEAGWFDVAELPLIPTPASIAGRLIRAVAAELQDAGAG